MQHNHYDHLDAGTVSNLLRRSQNRELNWIVPLKLQSTLVSLGVAEDRITELDWWQSTSTKTEDESSNTSSLRIVSVPAQHQTNRHVFDRMSTLWCGYAVIGTKERFYFSGMLKVIDII